MVKFKYFFAILFIGFLSFAQEKDSVKIADVLQNKIQNLNIFSHHQYSMSDKKPKILYPDLNKPEYPYMFLNDSPTSIEMIQTLNSKSIESVSREKYKDLHSSKEEERVIIKTKVKMISMVDFMKKYSIKTDKKVLISIDGEVLNESLENVFVDESNIMQVKVFGLDKIYKENNFTYLKILTRTAENVRKANEILIR